MKINGKEALLKKWFVNRMERIEKGRKGKKEKEEILERGREKIGARISVEWNKGMKEYRMKEKKYSLPI